MKIQIKLAALLILGTCNLQPATAHAQGALTPPGAPAPTMKTLDQIEPRTPISSAPFTISSSGSYYLTTNVTVSSGNGITIATNGVTLDLGGFTISSTAAGGSGTAILFSVSNPKDLTILNGYITGGVTDNGSGVYSGRGFASGIYYSGNQPVNVLVSKVSVSGCLDHGIYFGTGDATVVEDCTVRTMGSSGIGADTVKNCVATDCGGTGIYGDQVADSYGESTGNGNGIFANTTAQNCSGSSGSGDGLYASTAQNCYGYSSSGSGLEATTAENCNGQSAGSGYGIYASIAENCYGYSGSGDGLVASTAENCYGQSYGSGDGIYVYFIAHGCYGYSTTGTGLYAFIASVCHGATSSGTALTTTHNNNSF